MIIGQTLLTKDANTVPPPETHYFSPWFPSGGNEIHYTVDVIAWIGTAPSLDVEVQTKNSEMDDNSTGVITFAPVGCLIGRNRFSAGAGLGAPTSSQGLLEMVRFRYTVGSNADDGVHFRILNPTWLSNGA